MVRCSRKRRLTLKRRAKKEYAEVLLTQDEILKLVPGDPTQIQNRAVAKMAIGDLEGAVADYSLVLEKRKKCAPAFCKRAYAKMLLKDNVGALRDLDEALRLDADSLEALYRKAILLSACEDAAIRDSFLAKSLLEKAIAKAPKTNYTLATQAYVLAIEGKFKEAIATQEKAIQDKSYMEDQSIQGGAKAAERIAAWKEEKVWTIHR